MALTEDKVKQNVPSFCWYCCQCCCRCTSFRRFNFSSVLFHVMQFLHFLLFLMKARKWPKRQMTRMHAKRDSMQMFWFIVWINVLCFLQINVAYFIRFTNKQNIDKPLNSFALKWNTQCHVTWIFNHFYGANAVLQANAINKF